MNGSGTLGAYSNVLLALCIWREARNQTRRAMLGVKHVILNRTADPRGPYVNCKTIVENILAPAQFSSFLKRDPNAVKFPNNGADGLAWAACCDVVDGTEPDPTGGATHYHSYPVGHKDWPWWATLAAHTCQIEDFNFYKLS